MQIVERQWTTTVERPISIDVEGVRLSGELFLPEESSGLVLLAHGSELDRFNPGSQRIIRELKEQGLSVLAFDLLAMDEEDEEIRTGRQRVDIAQMASRYLGVADWAASQLELREMPVGFLSAGISAAAVLIAAAERPASLDAAVCLNGRADLAGGALAQVKAPTLLIVNAADSSTARSNEFALMRLGSARKEMLLIPGPAADFDEPEDLGTAAGLAAEWLSQSLILVG